MLRIITVIALILLGAILLLEAGLSLQWRMVHDAPLLSYVAWGMSTLGSVPYVDIFDMNAPGAYTFHVLVGHVFGFGDAGFRAADLLCLLLLSVFTWLAMRRFGRRVAFAACILFGLVYLGTGPDMSLQREYVALVPIAGAVLLAVSGWALYQRGLRWAPPGRPVFHDAF